MEKKIRKISIPKPSDDFKSDFDFNFKSDYPDDMLERCLNKGQIKVTERPENPPPIS